MSHPNTVQVHDGFLQIRKLGLRAADLEQRLQRAIRRDDTGSPEPDGYPISTAGGGGTSGAGSRVEATVLAREQPTRDRHHELTRQAVDAWATLVDASQTLMVKLAKIDQLTEDAPAPKRCGSCGGKRGKGNDRSDIYRGTVGDRLTESLDLCRACRGFVEQTAKAATRAGYLPSDEQIRQHEASGRWRIRTTARQAAAG